MLEGALSSYTAAVIKCASGGSKLAPPGDVRGLLPLRSPSSDAVLNDVNCWYSKRVNKIRYDSEIGRGRRHLSSWDPVEVSE